MIFSCLTQKPDIVLDRKGHVIGVYTPEPDFIDPVRTKSRFKSEVIGMDESLPDPIKRRSIIRSKPGWGGPSDISLTDPERRGCGAESEVPSKPGTGCFLTVGSDNLSSLHLGHRTHRHGEFMALLFCRNGSVTFDIMVEKAAKRYRESHTLYKHLKDERYSNTGVDFAYDDTGFFVIGYSKNGRRAVEHIKRAIVKETLLVNSDVFHDNLLSVEDRRLGRQHTRFDMLGGMMLLDSSRMIDADLDVFSRADAADKNMDDCMRLAQVENMLSAAGLRMKRIHYDYAAYFPALKAKSRHEIVVYLEPQWRGPIAAGWYTVEEVQALASSCQKPILEAV